MTPAMEAYDEVDGVEGFDDFESTAEAFPFRPGRKVFARGGLSSATLLTPKGQATLTMPQTVATLTQLRTVEQALNANTQRVNLVQSELARVRRELALRRSDPQSQNTLSMFLLLKLRQEFNKHKHKTDGTVDVTSDSSGFSTFLPFLMLQPGIFGQSGAGSSVSGTQDAMSSPFMLMALMDAI